MVISPFQQPLLEPKIRPGAFEGPDLGGQFGALRAELSGAAEEGGRVESQQSGQGDDKDGMNLDDGEWIREIIPKWPKYSGE